MKDGALIVTFTLGCITERHKFSMICSECIVCLLWGNFQDNYHECTHEEGSISQFVWAIRAVVEDTIVLVLVILSNQVKIMLILTWRRRANSRVYL